MFLKKSKNVIHANNPAVYHSQDSVIELNCWELSDFVIKKLVPIVGMHPFPLNELMLLSGTLCYFKPKAVFEWGTHLGKSARVFYETAKYFDIDCTVYSFDLPDEVEHNEHPHEQRGILVKGLPVKLFQEDGVEGASKLAKKKKYTSNEILFFVDGDHSYESVKRELTQIYKNHGYPTILLHDTFFQTKSSGYNVGPNKAITEFLKEHKTYKSISTNFGLPGMTLLYNENNEKK